MGFFGCCCGSPATGATDPFPVGGSGGVPLPEGGGCGGKNRSMILSRDSVICIENNPSRVSMAKKILFGRRITFPLIHFLTSVPPYPKTA